MIDCETTGLVGHPLDLVLSIGISEVDIINQTVDPFFNRILGYDTKKHEDIINKKTWIFDNSPLKLEDIQFAYDNGQTADEVAKEFNHLMKDKKIAYYNKAYDHDEFLSHAPFLLSPEQILPCLMVASTTPCAIPNRYYGGYKWPRLEEAVDLLLDEEIKQELNKSDNFHDAIFDTYAAGHVMLKLIEMGHYNILEYINQ